MSLLITTLLGRFERAEEVLRHTDHNGAQGQVNYKGAHEALTAARDLVSRHVELSLVMMSSTERSANDPTVLAAGRELSVFTAWMGLRQDKRWGDSINTKGPVALPLCSLGEIGDRVITPDGPPVQVLVGMTWENVIVSAYGLTSSQGGPFYFTARGIEQRFHGRDEGITWRRKP